MVQLPDGRRSGLSHGRLRQPRSAPRLTKLRQPQTNADVVLAVLGEASGMSSEAASCASLELPGIQSL